MGNQLNLASHQFIDKPALNDHNVTKLAELEYLGDMLPQMRRMAIGLREPTLAYLLEMAMTEAKLQLALYREADIEPEIVPIQQADIIKMR